MVGVVNCAATGLDEDMNEEITMEPERAVQSTSVVCLGEASRAAASFFNPAQFVSFEQ